ncbi:unnamed protein product [Pipistrellus nathusii]|uniref:Uteroglobin n=1 Tax=Pipistrellus nathusii TaxID=59473 RepID=A0ABP0AGG3_PIPNA
MKLTLPLLLVTLALCCPDANAGPVCPALTSVMTNFLLGPRGSLKREMNRVDAPAEAMQGTLNVKTCVDKLSLLDRFSVAKFVKIVEIKCKKQSA